jgi:hypothetical protein
MITDDQYSDLFYEVDGVKQDADLHNAILDEGDHVKAVEVSRRLMESMGMPADVIEAVLGKLAE